MDIKERFNKVIEIIEESSDNWINLKDKLPEIEVTEDFSSLVKLADKGIRLLSMRKFKIFLDGLFYEDISYENIDKLLNYVKNKEKAEFITNTFDKVLDANSRIACCIMGLLINEMINCNRDVEYKDLLLIQSLKELNDFEIKKFIEVCKIKELNINWQLNPIGGKKLERYKEMIGITDYELSLLKSNWEKSGIIVMGVIDGDMEDKGVDYRKEENGDSIDLFITKIGLLLFKYGEKVVECLDNN